MHGDLSESSTGSEDKRHVRKNGSHFCEARKRGRTMLYHLTSQFSRGGKREVSLGGVSTVTALLARSGVCLFFLLLKHDHSGVGRAALDLTLELLMLISEKRRGFFFFF